MDNLEINSPRKEQREPLEDKSDISKIEVHWKRLDIYKSDSTERVQKRLKITKDKNNSMSGHLSSLTSTSQNFVTNSIQAPNPVYQGSSLILMSRWTEYIQ